MACCGPPAEQRDYDDWRYPRTLEWKRLVTGEDVPLILAPSYERPLLPATTVEVPNPLHTRSAQHWFINLPDDTARAIMNTRRSMIREKKIVDTVLSMNPKPPSKDPRPTADMVLHQLAAIHQYRMAVEGKRGRRASSGPPPPPPGLALGPMPFGAVPPPPQQQQPYPSGTQRVHQMGLNMHVLQPAGQEPLALQPQSDGLPPPLSVIMARQQQMQAQRGRRHSLQPPLQQQQLQGAAGQPMAPPPPPGKIAGFFRAISPFKGRAQSPPPQQQMTDGTVQGGAPPPPPPGPWYKRMFRRGASAGGAADGTAADLAAAAVQQQQQQMQMQMQMAQPGMQPQPQPLQGPMSPQLTYPGFGAQYPGPQPQIQPQLQTQFVPQLQQQQQQLQQQQLLQQQQQQQLLQQQQQQQLLQQQQQQQLLQQQQQQQLLQQQQQQQLLQQQQQQLQQQTFGMQPIPSQLASQLGQYPGGPQPQLQPPNPGMQSLQGSRLGTPGPYPAPYQPPPLSPLQQQQQQLPFAGPVLPPPIGGSVALGPPPLPLPAVYDDEQYGLDTEVADPQAGALPLPTTLPPPVTLRRTAANLRNEQFGLGAEMEEAEVEAEALLPPPPLLQPPSTAGLPPPRGINGAPGVGLVRGPAPLSYNDPYNDANDLPEEPLEATATAAEQRLGFAPPSQRRPVAPLPRADLQGGGLGPRRIQRQPSLDEQVGEVEDVEEEYGLGAETAASGSDRPVGLPAARQLAGGDGGNLDSFSFAARDALQGGNVATPQKLRPIGLPTPSRLSRFGEMAAEDF